MRKETFNPRFLVALAALPGVLTSCTDDGDGGEGFVITTVAFDNESTITLTFSELVADVSGVDPNDFRLSVGISTTYTYTYDGVTETYTWTLYYDPGYTSYAGVYGALTFMTIEAGSSANQVVLRSTTPLGTGNCDWLDTITSQFDMYHAQSYATNPQIETGIFLHYAAGDIPIESDGGSVLANIGADWVLDGQSSSEREGFGFTMLNPQLRIPCP